MEQHLDGCADCREDQRELARLAELVRSPPTGGGPASLDHHRGRMRLLQAAALLDVDPACAALGGVGAGARPSRARWAMPAAAIALATLALMGTARRQRAASVRAPLVATVATVVPVVPRLAPNEVPPYEPPAVEPAGSTTPGPAVSFTLGTPAPVKAGEPTPPRSTERGAPHHDAQSVTMGDPQRVPQAPPQAPPVAARDVASSPSPPSSREAFAAGVGSMEQGNFGEAIDQLDAFRRSHPADARSEDAAFLVIVALQRAGRHEAAAAAAREYLASYPSGYRRGEAQRVAAHGE